MMHTSRVFKKDGRMKIYAKCPPTKCEYLTSGKEYEVLEDDGEIFEIIDNEGEVVAETWFNGLHADGNWERIVRDDAGDDTLTIRDQFAMAALALATDGVWDITKFSAVAERAYQIADAMMEARKK